MSLDKSSAEYWRRTLSVLATVLGIWALVSYGFGIVFREALDSISLGGYPLGFWFAQQGSIYVFIVLIFWYAARMNKLDQEFDVHEH